MGRPRSNAPSQAHPPTERYDRRVLRLLAMAPFQRRRGGWRFGTNRIGDDVVDRLLASGRVMQDGDRIVRAKVAP